MLGERLGERLELLRPDRQAGRGAVPAEALEELRAGAEGRVEVEGGTERPEPFHSSSLAACDEHDGAVEPLDEPRGDDPDHALVPVLAPMT